jgi:iron-sulfur cluster assembly accessory protein
MVDEIHNLEAKEIYVNKDMTIGDVVGKYPSAADVMTQYGLHCVGCHVNPFETIVQGAQAHGMSEELINEMISKVNDKISSNNESGENKIGNGASVKFNDVTMTDNAVEKIKELLVKEKKDSSYGLRIEVVPGGCSGFSYGFSIDNKKAENDKVFEKNGLKLFIDENSLKQLSGAQVDYVDALSGAGFKVTNPNAQSSCGCGKSFG